MTKDKTNEKLVQSKVVQDYLDKLVSSAPPLSKAVKERLRELLS